MHTQPIFRLALALICVASLGCAEEAKYKSVQFGVFSREDSKLTFQAQTLVLKANETIIGWAFDIENPPKQFTIREVISGPPGTSWPPGPGEVTDEGRTVSVVKTIHNPGLKFLFHNWTIDHTDVAGNYKATLYIDSKLIKEVDFVVSN